MEKIVWPTRKAPRGEVCSAKPDGRELWERTFVSSVFAHKAAIISQNRCSAPHKSGTHKAHNYIHTQARQTRGGWRLRCANGQKRNPLADHVCLGEHNIEHMLKHKRPRRRRQRKVGDYNMTTVGSEGVRRVRSVSAQGVFTIKYCR